jgi:phosphoribosylformylglycinamidine synthase
MNPVEVLTSESQERMLAIVEPVHLDAVLELARRWEVRATVVGRVTETDRFRVYDGWFDAIGVPGENPPPPRGDAPAAISSDREPVADVPAGSLGDGPRYDRPRARPAVLDDVRADDPAPKLRAKFGAGSDLGPELLALLATPTIAEKTWVSRQYDHQLFLNTVLGPGQDAALLRVKGTSKALALATDGKARFCALDPRTGGRLVVLEAARNVATTGARPLALVNCLNFGNPEHAEVMWQFAEVVEGISEACEALGIPVIGGNVSFYNETRAKRPNGSGAPSRPDEDETRAKRPNGSGAPSRPDEHETRGADIHPTPVVGVLGLVDELRTPPPHTELHAGDAIVVLGTTRPELGGSEWAAVVHGETGGRPPEADLDAARAVHALVAGLVADRDVSGVHDVSDGGLAVAIAEMAIAGAVGARVDLSVAGCTPAEACFSESASRVVCAVDPPQLAAVMARASQAGVPAAVVGDARGDRLVAQGAFDVTLDDAASAWREALPRLLEARP